MTIKSNRIQRYIKKGAIQDKLEKMEVLEVQIENLVKDLAYCTLFMDEGVESIDVKTAKAQMEDLEAKHAEYMKLKEESEALQ